MGRLAQEINVGAYFVKHLKIVCIHGVICNRDLKLTAPVSVKQSTTFMLVVR